MSFIPCGRFSSNSCSYFLQYSLGSSKNPVFDGFWGLLQLGVVGETSNMAHITLAVHTFTGKKEFFKSAQYFSLLGVTNRHTHIRNQIQILV